MVVRGKKLCKAIAKVKKPVALDRLGEGNAFEDSANG